MPTLVPARPAGGRGRTWSASRLTQSVLTALVAALVLVMLLYSTGNSPLSNTATTVAPVKIAYDSMARTVRTGFGSANLGGAYTVLGSSSQYRVQPGTGSIGPLSPGHTAAAYLQSVSAQDQDVRIAFSVPAIATSGYGTYVSLALRRAANGDSYLARVRVAPGGRLRVSLGKIVSRSASYFGNAEVAAPGTAHAGQTIYVEGEVVGTAPSRLAVRAWLYGSATPRWQYTRADTVPAGPARAGGLGVSVYQSAASRTTTLSLHNVVGYRLASAGSTPTPSPTPTTGSSASSTPAAPTSSAAPSSSTTPPSSSGTSSSPAPPPGGSGPARGAAPLGSTNYPIPADALYVSPSGSDGSGNGSLAAPFRSLGRALSAAQPGATIVLRGGSYNESVFVSKPVTIENYPGEVVWLDGSIPVAGWTKSGTTWVHSGWNYQFDSSASFTKGSNAGNFVDPAYPMAAHPDQVFSDGTQLTQVAANPVAGQFAVNYSAGTITVGSDPTGHEMRASNLQKAIVIGAGNVTVRGIGVRRYATSLWQMGAIYLGGQGTGHVLSDMVVSDNATQGISMAAPGELLDHVTVQNNGATGIHAAYASNSTIQNCSVTGNNAQHFNNAPASAGIKVTRLDGIVIRNNLVADNSNSNGIWTDENVTHFTIVNNTVANNSGRRGIINELSDTGIVASNVVYGSQVGYTAFDSGDIELYNNTLSGNSLFDIGLLQDDRYLPGHGTAGPSVQPSTADPWIVNHVVIVNNDMSRATGKFQLYALDSQTNRSADAMNLTVNGNLFLAGGPSMIAWGGDDNHTLTVYNSVQTFDAAKNPAWHNASTTSGASPMTVSTPSYAVPLPSDIAAAIGQPAGSQHVGAF